MISDFYIEDKKDFKNEDEKNLNFRKTFINLYEKNKKDKNIIIQFKEN